MSPQTLADVGIEIPCGRSGEVDTTCPQCSPTRKKRSARCLSVNTDRGTWFCHHCGWAGALGLNRTSYGAPLRRPIATPSPLRVYATPAPLPEEPLPGSVIQWFASRGIAESVLLAAGIRWKDGAALFPYLRHGTLINIKHRTRDKRFWMVAGAERILYGLDDIARAEIIAIVEGEIDKLSIDTVAGPPAVSVPDGAPPPDAKHYARKFAFLDETAMSRLTAARTILIATDMDAPGQKLADELARRIGYATCRRVSWHPYKDANEMLVAQGTQAVLSALASAEPFPIPANDAVLYVERPVHLLPPVRGRRPVTDLSRVEARHAS
jgi:twinkle protein